MKKTITIGTRASKLALWQAEQVKALLEEQGVLVTVKTITTKGDQILDRSLVAVGGKGLFLKEIEDELLAGTVDIAVHSMKDVPYEMPDGLLIAAVLKREDPSDAFVSAKYPNIHSLPLGAVVGTSSLRRLVQLKHSFPELEYKTLRGNVDTRLQKLDQGQYDAIILASAGLIRLGMAARITERLSIVPAAGQGIIGIECRAQDAELISFLKTFNHELTARVLKIERAFIEKNQGTCQTPIGYHVFPHPTDETLYCYQSFQANPDGSCFELKEGAQAW